MKNEELMFFKWESVKRKSAQQITIDRKKESKKGNTN